MEHPEKVDRSEISGRGKPHFMVMPSLACPAECSYCFGPHDGPVMSSETLVAALDLMGRVVADTRQDNVKVTFHGGEPLVAGHALWRQALDGLTTKFGPRRCRVAVQSNLWLLDDEYCRLFRRYGVEVGTSLDGPKEVTDGQRGVGYFARTMTGIRLAQAHGLSVGCIATFTPANVDQWREVFDFFLAERLNFSVHPAVPPLDGRTIHALDATTYAKLLCEMLDAYVEHRREFTIASLDQLCQAVASGDGKVCTFRDCLGMFLAIDPNGDLFACQRFAGRPEYRIGRLADHPTLGQLLASPMARRLADREAGIDGECTQCPHLAYCRGGCPYNAWAGGNGNGGHLRDPYCEAYREVLDHIQRRLTAEMAAEENIQAAAERPWDGRGHPLLRRGPLIELAREGPHPSQVARTAKRIVAAVELARGPDLPSVAARLVKLGVCRNQASAQASLAGLQHELHPPARRLNNLYVHLTFRCQLECRHCYARADAHGGQQPDLPAAALAGLLREAKDCGFRQVVITGGEPLIHHDRDGILAAATAARVWASPMNLVLRTNLALPLADGELRRIGLAFDQIVVSVDGNEATHDARRGPGTYAAVVANCERYQRLEKGSARMAELSLACVMRAVDLQGEAGAAVRQLAARLGVKRTRFRPLLPLGRAADWDEPPTSEAIGAYAHPLDLIEDGFRPIGTCGLGQNLYVEPSGESFPCYAFHRPHSYLGNVITAGLAQILGNPPFTTLAGHSVDTNPKCKSCDLRYLCGGACRAWGGEGTQKDLDAPPPECTGLKQRAAALLAAARKHLDLIVEELPCSQH